MSAGRVLSLDIGKSNMHLVIGSSKGGMIDVEAAFSLPTPSGSIKEGVISDRNAIVMALNEFGKTYVKFPKKAIVTVKSTSIITRELTIPEVPQVDIMPLVLLDMEQYLPNISKDYRTGIINLDTVKGPTGNMIKLRVFAVPKTLIEEYENLLKDCKMKPLVLDIQVNAVNKLVQRTYVTNKDKTKGWNWNQAAFVDLGYEITEINIFSSEQLLFTRQIPFGSNFMDSELVNRIGISEGALIVKKQEYIDLARNEFVNEEARQVNEVARNYVNRIKNEIQTVIQFYSGRVAEKRPEIIYLYGGNAHNRNIAEVLEDSIGIPIRILNDCPDIHSIDKHGQFDLMTYLTASAAIFRND